MITAPTHIEVAICTFRRPELADALESVARQRLPQRLTMSVLVVDNDELPSAEPIVRQFARSLALPVRYVHCPLGNIAIARNGALTHATARYLAFLDDDEEADTDWLASLAETQVRTGAPVILGPVLANYPQDTPSWLRRLDPHSTRPVRVGASIRTGYSCNVLMDLKHPAIRDRRFDLSLGRSGGEDTAFFTHAYRAGARFAEAKDAIVRERVTEARASFKWLARRRYRSGQTHGQLVADTNTGMRRTLAIGIACLKVAYCSIHALLVLPDAARRNGALLRGILHAGTIAGLSGTRPITLYGIAKDGASQ